MAVRAHHIGNRPPSSRPVLSHVELFRRALAELIGTALLLTAVIGSGIAAQTLSPNDTGLQLLENAAATGAALVAYVLAQIVGAAFGVVIANLMFGFAAVSISSHSRSSPNLWLGELVATFGLLLVIFGVTRSGRGVAAPFAVGAYITGAYFFTSSTSFANPALTLARTLSDTFAGIAPASVLPFIGAQLVGAAVACLVVRALWPRIEERAQDVVVPHDAAGVLA